MTDEQIKELKGIGREIDSSVLNLKRMNLTNYLNKKNINIDSLRGKIGRCKGIFLTSLKEKHGSNLTTIPLSDNSFYIFVDALFYSNNKEIVEFQLTHEMLHGMFNQKNNHQIHFGHSYQTEDQLQDFLDMTGINEACTQMMAEDIEGQRLNSAIDYMYDIKNIMRLMKIIYGEEHILKQYIYNTKDFENVFNILNSNQFNVLAHQINLIYKYDKQKYYKNLSPEEEQYINAVKKAVFDWMINLIDYYKKNRPEIIKEIVDEIDDDDFLLKINIDKNNLGYNYR